MCLLWTLLQFVVLAGYWDVPPISSQGGVVLLEMKQEEEEEAPLMRSDEEEARTYRAVDSDQSETSFASQRAHETSNPFKNFSVSNGERMAWLGLTEH